MTMGGDSSPLELQRHDNRIIEFDRSIDNGHRYGREIRIGRARLETAMRDFVAIHNREQATI